MDAAWRHTAAGAAQAEIVVDAEGRLHAASLDAIPDPPSLTELRRAKGESPTQIAKALGVSRASIYRHLAAADQP